MSEHGIARSKTPLIPFLAVVAILIVAVSFRAWLIADHRVAFESDEAVVGLMARHINAGEPLPTFYYGQAYMGSLDAILVAGGFKLWGASVGTIRLVQMILYLLGLGTAFGLARAVTHSTRVALIALLLLAIPTSLGALYTTISLGGYNEIVILGNAILLLGWQVTVEEHTEAWRWFALGIAAGLGWWVNGAIITAGITVGLLGLRYFAIRRWPLYGLAALGFLIGSAPWWAFNLAHDWEALKFLTDGFDAVPGTESITPGESFLGLVILGFPALYGLRWPWSDSFTVTAGLLVATLVYLLLATDMMTALYARVRYHHISDSPVRVRAVRWVVLVIGVFTFVFTFSSFSDATGRYLIPLWVPAAIGVALGVDRLRRAGWLASALLLAVILTVQAGSVIRAAESESGLTPQLVERLRTPAAYDADLLAFLAGEGVARGYAGYWTSFRVMFRAQESVILDTSLPYDDSGTNPGDNRYPPYRDQVAGADRVAWITQNFPALDALIAGALANAGVTYQTRDIGPYRVYYAFSMRITPADVGLESEQPHPALQED